MTEEDELSNLQKLLESIEIDDERKEVLKKRIEDLENNFMKKDTLRISFSPQMHALGCVTSSVSLGGFISGVYQGLSEAKGTPIDPTLKNLIRYGPVGLNGLLGVPAAMMVLTDKRALDNMVSNVPKEARQQAEGCAKGCAPIAFPIGGAALTAGLEYVGYIIGKSVGSSV